MIKKTSWDSERLVRYLVETPCFVCERGNNFDAELCRHCFAPMALAQQVQGKADPPALVATLGTADAGKTVYLGMLIDILSRENSALQAVARGAFSVSLQQATMAALARCQFPTKTPNEPDRWNWVHCQVTSVAKRRAVDLVMPDLAGEAIMEEIEHPGTYPVVRAFLKKCRGVMLLVDGARLEQGEKDQDFFTMKMVSYLHELDDDRKRGWPNRPVALIFTKADQCESCFGDAEKYARTQSPGLWRLCRERLGKHKFFAVGVAGACAYEVSAAGRTQIPLRIEPRGIVEPFMWLVQNIGK